MAGRGSSPVQPLQLRGDCISRREGAGSRLDLICHVNLSVLGLRLAGCGSPPPPPSFGDWLRACLRSPWEGRGAAWSCERWEMRV